MAVSSDPSSPSSTPSSPGSVLECEDVVRTFKGVVALAGVSFEIREREIFGIIGPNGSGKTTLVNAVTGFYPPNSGRISFRGRDITHTPPHRIIRLGIARTFQNLALFHGMSVLDNILLGRHIHMNSGVLPTCFYWWWGVHEEVRNRDVVEDVIEFLQLEEVREEPVEVIPLGLQRRVELARALAAEPDLLILDEPMAGMNQEEKEYMARFVLDARDELETTVILIEHNLDVVTGISDRIIVFDHGEKIAEGSPSDVVHDPAVLEAYTGGGELHVNPDEP